MVGRHRGNNLMTPVLPWLLLGGAALLVVLLAAGAAPERRRLDLVVGSRPRNARVPGGQERAGARSLAAPGRPDGSDGSDRAAGGGVAGPPRTGGSAPDTRPEALPRRLGVAFRHTGGFGARERRRAAVVDLCRAFAAELRGGRPPGVALASAVTELEPALAAELAGVAAVAREGGDPGGPLREAAARPGAGGLRQLAACWQVATVTGAGLAGIADRLALGLARERELHRELNAQLAGPRATAGLLTLLPLLGLAMAGALGTRPVAFLLTTPAGLVCLALGLLLDAAGLAWILRMVRGALAAGDRAPEDPPDPPEPAGNVGERPPWGAT